MGNELKRQALKRRAGTAAGDLWKQAHEMLARHSDSPTPKTNNITFRRSPPNLELGGSANALSPSAPDLEGSGDLRITLFPAAIHLCQLDFTDVKAAPGFHKHSSPPTRQPRRRSRSSGRSF